MEGTGAALNEVTVRYKSSRGDLPALGPVTLGIGAAEFVAVLGPSGCGKSTLLKVLAGLIRPSSGNVVVAGGVPRPGDVGIVFQQPTLLPWKTVRENVLVPLEILQRRDAAGRRHADELLHLVGLSAFADHYPNELSGGMQQRVAVARGLVNRPKLLLMDEPFAALDAITREQMMMDLQSVWSGCAVVLVTHSVQEATFLADRIVTVSARPARIVDIQDVTLARPRTLESMSSAPFAEICDHLRRLMLGQTEAVAP